MPTVTKPAIAHTAVSTGWTNPGNAFASAGDNVYATVAPAKNNVRSGDFGFADILAAEIPDGSTISAVRLVAEAKLSAVVTGGLFGLQGMLAGIAQGTESTLAGTTTESGVSFAFPADSVTLADLRAASTVLMARCRGARGNTNTGVTVSLDFVRLEVDYVEPPATAKMNRTVIDTVPAPTDSISRSTSISRSIADVAPISDSVARSFSGSRTIVDQAPAADSLARQMAVQRSVGDVVGVSDSVSRAMALGRSLSDVAPVSETIERRVRFSRSAIDGVQTSDTVSRRMALGRTVADAVATADSLLADLVAAGAGMTRTIVDVVASSDAISRVVRMTRRIFDSAGVSDSVSATSSATPPTVPLTEETTAVGAELAPTIRAIGVHVEDSHSTE